MKFEVTSCKNSYNGQYENIYDGLSELMMLETKSKNTISPEDVKVSWVRFVVYYEDRYSKNNHILSKRVTITNGNKISGLEQEDVDFEIIECFKKSGVLKINS
ncbi:MAG: hypothetical protein PHY80_06355 [Rickettsiales bacterium]|nr:hypothetical protein [Rickettsiales bacterium]